MKLGANPPDHLYSQSIFNCARNPFRLFHKFTANDMESSRPSTDIIHKTISSSSVSTSLSSLLNFAITSTTRACMLPWLGTALQNVLRTLSRLAHLNKKCLSSSTPAQHNSHSHG